MQDELSFYIAVDGEPFPLRFESKVLDEFNRDYIETLDDELRELSDISYGPTFFLERGNRLGVVAPLIRDAMLEKDGIKVAKYVLWVVSRYPEISGIRINENSYEFLADVIDSYAPSNMTVH